MLNQYFSVTYEYQAGLLVGNYHTYAVVDWKKKDQKIKSIIVTSIYIFGTPFALL